MLIGELGDESSWDEEWERVDLLLDSGASISALPANVATSYPAKAPQGLSEYRAANGNPIKNEGSRTIKAVTSGGARKMAFSVMDVRRPIASVSKIVSSGNEVHFTPEGSWVKYRSTGNFDRLHEKSGVYVLPAWIPPFQGQPKKA